MSILEAILIAIIEGLTEFLPVSSTAHMVITSSLLRIEDDPFTRYFEISVQFGAILSVLILYFKKFIDFKSYLFYVKLLVAVIPSLIFGYLLDDFIDDKLGSPVFIAIIMVLGGIVLLFIDKWLNKPIYEKEEQISLWLALRIGLFQCLAILFPGLSRSAATIIGGMSQNTTRELAAEFSFFLAVPTMFAATAYKTLSYIKKEGAFTGDQLMILGVGNLVAFVVAMLAIKFFISFVKARGFRLFGIYRIILGSIVLILAAMKIIG